jgi:formylmethanofuran dehydrogenase subunit E
MNVEDPREKIKSLLRGGDLTGLLVQAARIHGHYCPGLASGVMAGWAGMKRLGFDNTGMEELLAVVECNNCFVDGIQMTTGCTLGNNALIYKDLGKTAVTIMSRKTGSAVRIALRPKQRNGEDDSEQDKEAALLFELFVIKDVEMENIDYAPILESVICAECGEKLMESRARIRNGQPLCLQCARENPWQMDGSGIRMAP